MSELAKQLKAANPEAGNIRIWVNGQDMTDQVVAVQVAVQTEQLPPELAARVTMNIVVAQDFTELTPALEQLLQQLEINKLRAM